MRFTLIFCMTLGISGALVAATVERLPLGRRQYLFEAKVPYAPVEIAPLGQKAQGRPAMRDPIPLGKEPNLAKGREGEPKTVRPKKISRMVFEQVAVKGRYLVPRVSFVRPVLDLQPSEQPTTVDYRKKIKSSEEILKSFDW